MNKNGNEVPLREVTSRLEGDVVTTVLPGRALRQNRSLISLLGMALAIVAPPFAIGGPLISSIYGGGQLSMVVGLFIVMALQGCVALSLSELASRWPTSSGVYYWSYILAEGRSFQKFIAYLTGWSWVVGNWTICLSVNAGFGNLIAATATAMRPEWIASPEEQLGILFGVCILVFIICAFSDRFLPIIDTMATLWNAITILAIILALAITAKAGRHSASYGLGHYDGSLSGYDKNFSFMIGLLPPAYIFSAVGMIVSMAEECANPATEVPRGISLTIPFGGLGALLFILPIAFTLPPLEDILAAPYGQVIPYIFGIVTESKALTLALMIMILFVTMFCSISCTTTASRCTWALSRDGMLPGAGIWARTAYGRPLHALVLVTVIQLALGCIVLGSSTAFLGFTAVGVMALAMGYLIPISLSLFIDRRVRVSEAVWKIPFHQGPVANVVAVLWILLELALFSMPIALPVTATSMNYGSAVFAGFGFICIGWYLMVARKQSLHVNF